VQKTLDKLVKQHDMESIFKIAMSPTVKAVGCCRSRAASKIRFEELFTPPARQTNGLHGTEGSHPYNNVYAKSEVDIEEEIERLLTD